MVKILITGSNGQLGSSIRKHSSEYGQFEFTYIDIQDLNLTHEEAVRDYFRRNTFHYIINCAAYTAVDQAEKETEKAFAVNANFPVLLASSDDKHETRFIHISSDYVYDGKRSVPHDEEESLQAISAYARSKQAGEEPFRDNPNAIIIRTSWLYSEFGNNFLKTMLRLSKEKTEIGVVTDQTGTPTYAGDLADALLKIIAFSEHDGFRSGVYNYSNEGVCSWFDFAVEIMYSIGSHCQVNPIRTSEYPLPATRPEYSVLDKNKIKQTFGLKIPHWRASLLKAVHH